MKNLRLAYFGTPDFSAHLLEKILNDKDLPVEVNLVVTQPDKPVGRKKNLTPSPVKKIALEYNIQLFDGSIASNEAIEQLNNIDLVLLYAYGEIISRELLETPEYGFWNIHPSLLPRYRGPSPTAYPLIMGDTETGVTLMKLDEKMDHGPIISQEKYTITPEERRGELEEKLTDMGFQIFRDYIVEASRRLAPTPYPKGEHTPLFLNTSPPLTIQKEDDATYTKLLRKDDGFIPLFVLKKTLANEPLKPAELPQILKNYFDKYPDLFENWKLNLETSSEMIFNYFRGLYSWPGIWTTIEVNGVAKRLKILGMEYEENKIKITEVQLEGKSEVDFSTFNSAYHVFS